tara:strand:+ start:4558 stop:5424 length:867 start_codon:yes stop_codon:yes gene_type:complete
MKCGIHFHQAGLSGDRIVIRDFVQAAEDMGFNHISVPDHVIQAGTPRGPAHMAPRFTREFPYHETMTLMAFIAAITETIEINAAVIILPQRQTVLVAKQAAEVDVLSGGRLRLGVGLGWNELEFEALGMNFGDRGKRVEEQIHLMRRLWTEELVTFSGQWHKVSDAGLAPMPLQRPIPLWIGANSEIAVRRAGRLADGWFIISGDQPGNQTRAYYDAFCHAAELAGRDARKLGIEATVHGVDSGPDAWMETAKAWKDIGVTQLTFRPDGPIDELLGAMQEFFPMVQEL